MKTTTSSSIQGRRRRGSTYISVVITMSVVGLMLAAYLKLVDVQNQLTMRSQTWNRTVPVMEAGIEEAIAHLNLNGSPEFGGVVNLAKLNNDGWSGNSTIGWTKTSSMDQLENGTNGYTVFIEPWSGSTNAYPKIIATGYVATLPAFAFKQSFSPFLAAINFENLVSNRVALRRVVECATTNNPTFIKGLVAKRDIDLNGNNIETDSYDSSDPAASNNGLYDPRFRRDNGDIASNGSLINVGNATIRGSVATGPFGRVNLRNGVVGESWYVDIPANSGTIQSNHFTDDMNVQFEDAAVPGPACSVSVTSNCVNWTTLSVSSGTTEIDGTNYNYVLDSGNYKIDNFTLQGSIYIRGAVRLWITAGGGLNITGQDKLFISGATNSLALYVGCADANISGKGMVNNTGNAANFMYFGLNNNRSLSLGGNSAFVGSVYAPYANLSLNGGGNPSEYNDFCGAAIVGSAQLNGHFRFHYDESLPKRGMWRGFKVTSWNEK